MRLASQIHLAGFIDPLNWLPSNPSDTAFGETTACNSVQIVRPSGS